MIRVNRGQPPDGFNVRSTALRRKFLAARRHDPDISASKFWASVRHSLRADANELSRRCYHKCAYCESHMRHVSYPHIEHYRPKGQRRFERLMFVWDNWLLSCGVCNDEKWTEFPQINGQPALLDPAVDVPEQHFGFRRNIIFELSDRGKATIQLVCLDRRDLESERGAWLLQIDALLLLAIRAESADIRRESRAYLIWAMQDDAPYAAMTRRYLAEICPKLANPQIPHEHVVGEDIRRRIAILVANHLDAANQLG